MGGSKTTAQQNGIGMSLSQKAFTRDLDWRKDELRDVVFWVIVAFSAVLGSVYGLLGLQGMPCFVSYFAGIVLVPSFYWTSFLGINDEDYGGKMEVLGDSIGSGAAAFVLSWIGIFTLIH